MQIKKTASCTCKYCVQINKLIANLFFKTIKLLSTVLIMVLKLSKISKFSTNSIVNSNFDFKYCCYEISFASYKWNLATPTLVFIFCDKKFNKNSKTFIFLIITVYFFLILTYINFKDVQKKLLCFGVLLLQYITFW